MNPGSGTGSASITITEHAYEPGLDEVEIRLEGVSEPVVFVGGRLEDGPAVLHDASGPLIDCQLCGYAEGFPDGPVGEVLARAAADTHRCVAVSAAYDTLRAHAAASLKSS